MWGDCVFLKNSDEIKAFLNGQNEVLLVAGLGFDPRACNGIKLFSQVLFLEKVWMVDYNEKSSKSKKTNEINKNENIKSMMEICGKEKIEIKPIPAYKGGNDKSVLIISESIRDSFTKESIGRFKRIIIDISAMPRSVSFSIIKRLVDIKNSEQKLYIFVSENSFLDDSIVSKIKEGSAQYLLGFNTFSLTMQSNSDDTIWLPVLGTGKKAAFDSIAEYLQPIEICPIIPFPSIDIKRSENVLREYGKMFFQERNVDKRNIIYVPENYPLIMYKKIIETVHYYEKVLNDDKDKTRHIRYAFSSQSSKLIDIGLVLSVMSLVKDDIMAGIVVVENQDYENAGSYDPTKDQLCCICLDDSEFDG